MEAAELDEPCVLGALVAFASGEDAVRARDADPRDLGVGKAESEEWYAAVCLSGEAGLRVGEIKALRWREDVDLIAKTITVNQQTCRGETGTPKGRTRRTVPMTTTLHDALKRMSVIRDGHAVRNLDGTADPAVPKLTLSARQN